MGNCRYKREIRQREVSRLNMAGRLNLTVRGERRRESRSGAVGKKGNTGGDEPEVPL